MADDDRRAEGKVRAQGKKGIRTKATIKNNNWDQKFTRGDFVVYGSEKVVYSLNKQGRWEEVACLRAEVAAQPREHTEEEPAASSETTSKEEADVAAPAASQAVSLLPFVSRAESAVHADRDSRALKPNPNRTKDHTAVSAVIDVKSHSSSDVCNRKIAGQPIIDEASSKHMGVNIPRHGFSGGGFITSAGGRNFYQKRGVYCGDCCTQIGTIECPTDEAEATETGEASKHAEKAPEKQETENDEEVEENDDEEEEEDEEEGEEEAADDGDSGEEEAADAKKVQVAGAPAKGHAKGVGTRRAPSKSAVADQEDWAAEGELWVQHSFKRGEYPLFRETRTQHSTPCMGCFISQGPVWMLRGMGDKARKKTKGFKKITRRDLSLHTD